MNYQYTLFTKKNIIKQKIILIVFFLLTINISSQIGMSKTKAMETYSENFLKEGKTSKGIEYIVIQKDFENKISGKFVQYKAIYFDIEIDNIYTCSSYKIVEPSSEINNWIKVLNELNYIKLSQLKYKDYERSLIYEISTNQDTCILNVYFDNQE